MRNRLLQIGVIIIIVLWRSFIIVAQTEPSSEMAAAALLKAQKWAEATSAYGSILESEPNNGGAWYQMGSALYQLKQYPKSAEAFEKAASINSGGFAMYNAACSYALMGDKEKAIEWLAKAIDNPKMVLAAINFSDPDLAIVKDDARVKAMMDRVDRKIRPCIYSAEAKQFNFWVGEWDVFNPQGRHDGTSVIQSFANGCGILENWTDSFGGTGKSINFYDTGEQKWYQYWIGGGGGPGRWAGPFKDGAIRYENETVDKTGKKTLGRLTFFDIDQNTVRQWCQSSTDSGKTWTTNYDYRYVRKK